MSFYSLVLFLVFLLLTNKLVYFDVLKLVVIDIWPQCLLKFGHFLENAEKLPKIRANDFCQLQI